MIVAAGQLFLVELEEHAFLHRRRSEEFFLRFASVYPKDALRCHERSHFLHPVPHRVVGGHTGAELLGFHGR